MSMIIIHNNLVCLMLKTVLFVLLHTFGSELFCAHRCFRFCWGMGNLITSKSYLSMHSHSFGYYSGYGVDLQQRINFIIIHSPRIASGPTCAVGPASAKQSGLPPTSHKFHLSYENLWCLLKIEIPSTFRFHLFSS